MLNTYDKKNNKVFNVLHNQSSVKQNTKKQELRYYGRRFGRLREERYNDDGK